MKFINDFARLFGVEIEIEERLVVKRENRYFLLDDRLMGLAAADFFYGGTYLGKIKDARFFPSFNLLKIIAEKEAANKVFVDKKSEWLFICGRDIFKQRITKVVGSKRKGDYVLVLNQHDECLGFGKILQDLDKVEKGVAVKNILDIGDFLRRERWQAEWI
jgi:ribosome biogenesis protein Nip4